PGSQPRRNGRQDGTASTTHVEHAFVAVEAKAVDDFVPYLELAAPGGVEKAGRVRQKERAVESERRRQVVVLPPAGHDRSDHAGSAEHGKGLQRIGRVVAVVSLPLHRDDIFFGMAEKDNWRDRRSEMSPCQSVE